MNKEELIQLLITLKMQSRYSSNGTFIEDIKPSSFIFVINSAIEALKALKDESYWKESYEAELNKNNRLKRQLEDTVSRQAVLNMIDNALKIINEYKTESEDK